MDLEIKERTQIKASIYGKPVSLKKPTIGQIERLQTEMAKGGEVNRITVMKQFGTELGLPAEMCDQLEMDHFIELIEHLTGQSKKK